MREWYRRPGNAEAQRASARRSRERRLEEARAYDRRRGFHNSDPVKQRARRIANAALAAGKLKREPCERAGPDCRGRIEMHHDDYSQPLDVRWLCKAHHGVAHRTVAA